MLDGLISIGEDAFENCTSLTSVTIPTSVTGIGDVAFSACDSLASLFFTGNAPIADSSVFSDDSSNLVIYYLPGATGWDDFSTNTGISTVLWNPLIQASGSNFGISNNQFGFDITGTNNFTVVVEACANLASPIWTPLQNVTLTNGSFYFSEPLQTNTSARFYSLQMP
jgi:hypothetical protein